MKQVVPFRKPLIVGVNVPTSTAGALGPVERARLAEDLGFDFVSANDHPCGTAGSYEVWTMLCWIAARTDRIKVASRVLGLPYRAPAMVAKMAESLARLSGGRLILGLGGGSADDEFRAFGLNVPTPKEKVEGLEEAVQIIRGLWSSADFTFEGAHFNTRAANIEPKPESRIPVWLGTFGPKALRATGRVADGWIPSLSMAPPEKIPRMKEHIAAGADDVGRSADEVAFVYNIDLHMGNGPNLAPHVLAGSPEQVAEQLAALAPLGLSGINLSFTGGPYEEQIQGFGHDVLPVLRAQLPA